MRFIADLHVHSKYARACSPALTPENIAAWCKVKGVDIITTGDFTHPRWFEELKKKLRPSEQDGLYLLREELTPSAPPPIPLPKNPTFFLFGTEVACIYSHGGKVRRVHHCIYAPSLEVAAKINTKLAARGCKLASDGRPILGMSSKTLLELLLEVDPRNVLIPAHAWTPWFAIFGSKSGYDSIKECFEDLTPHIFAIETGLSSDPPMNWRVKNLDNVALVSSSDAHSLPNLAREANVFEGEEKDLSYDMIMEAIRQAAPVKLGENRKPAYRAGRQETRNKLTMLGTIEFIPDEGRYHFDGHRVCKVRLHPQETKKLHNLCPKCKKEMTIGVLSRVEELANEPTGRKPESALQYWGLVELDKIIAEALGIHGRSAKAVDKLYWALVEKAGTELNALLNYSLEELSKITELRVVEAIRRVREGKVTISPGYDGEYGVVQIFSAEEKKEAGQRPLF